LGIEFRTSTDGGHLAGDHGDRSCYQQQNQFRVEHHRRFRSATFVVETKILCTVSLQSICCVRPVWRTKRVWCQSVDRRSFYTERTLAHTCLESPVCAFVCECEYVNFKTPPLSPLVIIIIKTIYQISFSVKRERKSETVIYIRTWKNQFESVHCTYCKVLWDGVGGSSGGGLLPGGFRACGRGADRNRFNPLQDPGCCGPSRTTTTTWGRSTNSIGLETGFQRINAYYTSNTRYTYIY